MTGELNRTLHPILGAGHPYQLPLLLLHESDGHEHLFFQPIVVFVVVVIKPEVRNGEEQVGESLALQQIQDRSCHCDSRKDSIFNDTITLIVLDVEIGALDALSPHLRAAPALVMAELLTNSIHDGDAPGARNHIHST